MIQSLTVSLAIFCIASNLAHGEESGEKFETTITKEVAAPYLVVTPESFSKKKTYPLLIFLHGRGESGDDLEKVAIHGPYKTVADLKLPFIIVAPQTPIDERWDVDMLSALVDHVLEELPVDKDRVYLTGLSLGGFATWDLALRRPEVFAAIAPICGHGKPSQAAKIKDLPVWAFHGALDPVVSLAGMTDMINALYAVDNDARFTVYPNAGHDSWTETYKNPKLYEWLLSHSKSK
jgi:predicted peptidase